MPIPTIDLLPLPLNFSNMSEPISIADKLFH